MTAYLDAYSGGGGGGTDVAPDVTPVSSSATSVPVDAETTVVSRAVPATYTMKLHGVVVSGNADAEWILYDDATEVLRFRTMSSKEGRPFTWANGISFATGHVVSLKVIHQTTDLIAGSTSRNFYATLLYRDA